MTFHEFLTGAFPLLVVALTSAAVYALARRRFGLPPAGLRRALPRLLETAGLAVGLYVLQVAVAVGLTALARGAGLFVSIYLSTDLSLLVAACLQAVILELWVLDDRARD